MWGKLYHTIPQNPWRIGGQHEYTKSTHTHTHTRASVDEFVFVELYGRGVCEEYGSDSFQSDSHVSLTEVRNKLTIIEITHNFLLFYLIHILQRLQKSCLCPCKMLVIRWYLPFSQSNFLIWLEVSETSVLCLIVKQTKHTQTGKCEKNSVLRGQLVALFPAVNPQRRRIHNLLHYGTCTSDTSKAFGRILVLCVSAET